MVVVVKVTRRAGSRGLNIPRPLLRELGWNLGDMIALACLDGRLVAQLVDAARLLEPAQRLEPVAVKRRRA